MAEGLIVVPNTRGRARNTRISSLIPQTETDWSVYSGMEVGDRTVRIREGYANGYAQRRHRYSGMHFRARKMSSLLSYDEFHAATV